MKKPIFPRILLLLILYGVVFVILVMAQFAKQGGFTLRVGNFVISGQYRMPREGDPPPVPNLQPLTGELSVFFGGMEFRLSGEEGENGFAFIDKKNERTPVLPESMTLEDESVLFHLPQGADLSFSTQYVGGKAELQILASLPEELSALELPFKPLRNSGIRDSGNGNFTIRVDGISYSFKRPAADPDRRILVIRPGSPLSYGIVPEKKAFSPEDYTVPQAAHYGEILSRWRDRNFSLWNRIIANQNDEDMVIAYSGEAVSRGTYKSAVSSIPSAFIRGTHRSHESSVYLGRLGEAFRSLSAAEREKLSRLSRLINEKSLDFLKEIHVIGYFAVRGYGSFMDDGAELIKAMDPSTLSLELTPGIFEGYMDWKFYRPRNENPFERLVDQACYVISGGIMKDPSGERVLVFHGGQGDLEFNLRLGKALLDWAEQGENGPWAGLARSLILSTLALEDSAGSAPRRVEIAGTGEIAEESGGARISTARLYHILAPGEYGPRALSIGAVVNGLWAWTAAASLSASQENNVLDISVGFPAGETHYMLVRGVRPFTKIQLYGMDFRTDPQFERYDSSGWVYQAAEQTLLLKMRHRAAVEHIRLFY
jgi:hypothetical protein